MEKQQPEIIDVELIPKGTEVTFSVDTNLHTRLQQLLLVALPYKDQEHFQKCLKEVSEGKVEDPLAYHMQTILYLIEKFEYTVKEQNKMVTKKFSFKENKFLDDESDKD